MFLANSSACLTGIALKRTSFKTTNEFLETILFVDQFHHFIFIDYEGIKNLVSPSQLELILNRINHFLVFTIAARGREFHFNRDYLLENYLRIARSNPNLFFCVVAGHPAYKSVDTGLHSVKALHNIFTRVRKKTNSILFFGIENIPTNVIQQITIQYDPIIPILLHGDQRFPGKLSPPLAIYSPLAHFIPEKEAIVELIGYLYRRKQTRRALTRRGYFLFPPINWNDLVPDVQTILHLSFQQHALTSRNYKSRINSFLENGVQLVIGYPALKNHFVDLVKHFKVEIVRESPRW